MPPENLPHQEREQKNPNESLDFFKTELLNFQKNAIEYAIKSEIETNFSLQHHKKDAKVIVDYLFS